MPGADLDAIAAAVPLDPEDSPHLVLLSPVFDEMMVMEARNQELQNSPLQVRRPPTLSALDWLYVVNFICILPSPVGQLKNTMLGYLHCPPLLFAVFINSYLPSQARNNYYIYNSVFGQLKFGIMFPTFIMAWNIEQIAN